MNIPSKEQREYATAGLLQLIETRGLKQTQLHHLSGVDQSTISKIQLGRMEPNYEMLARLYKALGLNINDILHESDIEAHEILGYLATPLTGLDAREEDNVRKAIEIIKEVSRSEEFKLPSFDLYWPGDHTHPTKHPEFSPEQVYAIDRSRASTFDFIILLCASPSYGVGQENEIATQAGLPAIRLMPEGISRMMSGSFVCATDIVLRGAPSTGIHFDRSELVKAFRHVRQLYFQHLALYKNVNGNDFGQRLRALINDRSGDYAQFAEKLGVSPFYLQTLMDEPFAVTNPSARLLKRMAHILNVTVGYLVGETGDADPVWIESMANFHSWIRNTKGVEAAAAFELREEFKTEFHRERHKPALASFRNSTQKAVSEIDWDKRYKQKMKAGLAHNAQNGLF
jgi:transcriptional regulator with XRE-family HTH domain